MTVQIYLAGRIRYERDRFGVVACNYDHDLDLGDDLPPATTQFRHIDGRDAVYTGPFTISCDHGCAHSSVGDNKWHEVVAEDGTKDYVPDDPDAFGTRGHGANISVCLDGPADTATRKKQVHINSLIGIRHADVVFAYLDDTECYGTLVEIGFAYAHGKPIYIGKPQSLTTSELWFAEQCATAVYTGSTSYCLARFWSAIMWHDHKRMIQSKP